MVQVAKASRPGIKKHHVPVMLNDQKTKLAYERERLIFRMLHKNDLPAAYFFPSSK